MLRFWQRNYSVAHPDFEPHSVIKVMSGSRPKIKAKRKHEEKSASVCESQKEEPNKTKANVNEMGIQMISKNLFQQIFRNSNASLVDVDLIDK